MYCPGGYHMQILSLLQQYKMKWQADSNKIVVSRFYRLKEWPLGFILKGEAADSFLD